MRTSQIGFFLSVAIRFFPTILLRVMFETNEEGCLVDTFTLWFEHRFTFRCCRSFLYSIAAGRCDGPHSCAAFLARGSATSKLFNMRRDGGSGRQRRRRRGPFQGRNFSAGSLEKSIPLQTSLSLQSLFPLLESGKTCDILNYYTSSISLAYSYI